MLELQKSLVTLRNFVIEQEKNNKFNENFPKCQQVLIQKIQSMLNTKNNFNFDPSLQGHFKEIFNQLELLKGVCQGHTTPEKLSEKIQCINGLLLPYFSEKEFECIKKFSNIVNIFRLAKENMASGKYGSEAQKMVIEDDFSAMECIPKFAILNVMPMESDQYILLYVDFFKMLREEAEKLVNSTFSDLQKKRATIIKKTIPYFENLIDWLRSQRLYVCKHLEKNTKQIVYKKIANAILTDSEKEALLNHPECEKLIKIVTEISQILATTNRSAFTIIMKGASLTQDKFEIEKAKSKQEAEESKFAIGQIVSEIHRLHRQQFRPRDETDIVFDARHEINFPSSSAASSQLSSSAASFISFRDTQTIRVSFHQMVNMASRDVIDRPSYRHLRERSPDATSSDDSDSDDSDSEEPNMLNMMCNGESDRTVYRHLQRSPNATSSANSNQNTNDQTNEDDQGQRDLRDPRDSSDKG